MNESHERNIFKPVRIVFESVDEMQRRNAALKCARFFINTFHKSPLFLPLEIYTEIITLRHLSKNLLKEKKDLWNLELQFLRN